MLKMKIIGGDWRRFCSVLIDLMDVKLPHFKYIGVLYCVEISIILSKIKNQNCLFVYLVHEGSHSFFIYYFEIMP